MLKELPIEFTQEQISQFARANVRAITLATTTFYRDKNIDPQEFWYHAGGEFSGSWDWVQTTGDLMFGILGNVLSMGFELLSISGDEYGYTAEVSGWPSDQELDFFELLRSETDSMWTIFFPITDALAHDFSWQRDGEIVSFSVTRR